MRPPMRLRASRRQTRLPAPERTRAAARPAAPAPITAQSYLTRFTERRSCGIHAARGSSFADDFAPGELADELHLLVDVHLCGLVAEDAAEVIDLGGDQAIALREEANR